MIPTSIDGTDITGATIDGTDVTEITVDGDTVFKAKTIIESFEDNSLADYSGTGSLASTSPLVDSIYLESGDIYDTSASGPDSGDTFEFFVRPTANSFTGLYIKASTNSRADSLFITVNTNQPGLSIYEYNSSGNIVQFSEQRGLSISNNNIYRIETVFTGNDLTSNIFEKGSNTSLGSVTLTGQSRTGTGIGWDAQNGELDFLALL